jgi:hypothetical protein
MRGRAGPTSVALFLAHPAPGLGDEAGADMSGGGDRPVHTEAERGGVDSVRFLSGTWPGTVKATTKDGKTLRAAARAGKLSVVQHLVEGRVPPHDAASGGSVEVARLLWEQWQNAIRVKTFDEGDAPGPLRIPERARRCRPVLRRAVRRVVHPDHHHHHHQRAPAVPLGDEQREASRRSVNAGTGRSGPSGDSKDGPPCTTRLFTATRTWRRLVLEQWPEAVRERTADEGSLALPEASSCRDPGRGRGLLVATWPESVRHADGDLALHVATAARRVETALTTTTDGKLPIHEPGRGMARDSRPMCGGGVERLGPRRHPRREPPFACGGLRQKAG